jgi:hypothetical protein
MEEESRDPHTRTHTTHTHLRVIYLKDCCDGRGVRRINVQRVIVNAIVHEHYPPLEVACVLRARDAVSHPCVLCVRDTVINIH